MDKQLVHTKESFAELLNGREIGNEISRLEESIAKENGLVAVFGYSDDGMEFRGAISDEVGAFGGGTAKFTKSGVFHDEDDDEVLEKYGNEIKFNEIKSSYGSDPNPDGWSYTTTIPHAPFHIKEDEDLYCVGIVFNISDLI